MEYSNLVHNDFLSVCMCVWTRSPWARSQWTFLMSLWGGGSWISTDLSSLKMCCYVTITVFIHNENLGQIWVQHWCSKNHTCMHSFSFFHTHTQLTGQVKHSALFINFFFFQTTKRKGWFSSAGFLPKCSPWKHTEFAGKFIVFISQTLGVRDFHYSACLNSHKSLNQQ